MKKLGLIVLAVLLMGSGFRPHSTSPGGAKMDILFVVDNSGSMATSQSILASYAETILRDLTHHEIDFQIAVITTEAYKSALTSEPSWSKFRSYKGISVLTGKTPDLSDVFAALIRQGVAGVGDERAFMSIRESLKNPLNAGFLRANAYLSVFILSDEDDFSHNGKGSKNDIKDPYLHTINQYVEFLKEVTGSGKYRKKFRVSAMAIFDQACLDQMESGRKIGYRYAELIQATKGEQISICEPSAPIFWPNEYLDN